MNNAIDKLITRLRDLAFGRPRIKVVHEKVFNDYEVAPIFIVGTFRSGTTLLRFMLDSHSRICCAPESKLLKPLASLYAKDGCMRALRDMGYDESYVRRKVRELSDCFFVGHMLAQEKARWADKTPEYVRILDFIEWLYGPHCKYVLIYRNGLDVANSMNENYIEPLDQQKSLMKCFEYWAHDTEIMADWERRYPRRCYSLKYEDLCTKTTLLMRELFDFLEEDWEDGVLKWYEKGHVRGHEDIKARRQRGIKFSFGNYRDWPENLEQELKERAASLHELIGYDPETLMPSK